LQQIDTVEKTIEEEMIANNKDASNKKNASIFDEKPEN